MLVSRSRLVLAAALGRPRLGFAGAGMDSVSGSVVDGVEAVIGVDSAGDSVLSADGSGAIEAGVAVAFAVGALLALPAFPVLASRLAAEM